MKLQINYYSPDESKPVYSGEYPIEPEDYSRIVDCIDSNVFAEMIEGLRNEFVNNGKDFDEDHWVELYRPYLLSHTFDSVSMDFVATDAKSDALLVLKADY